MVGNDACNPTEVEWMFGGATVGGKEIEEDRAEGSSIKCEVGESDLAADSLKLTTPGLLLAALCGIGSWATIDGSSIIPCLLLSVRLMISTFSLIHISNGRAMEVRAVCNNRETPASVSTVSVCVDIAPLVRMQSIGILPRSASVNAETVLAMLDFLE